MTAAWAEGERIKVQTKFFEGMATILYVAPGEFYPVQVEMDAPDPDGHNIQRITYHEIVDELPAESTSAAVAFEETVDPQRHIGEVVQEEAGYSFKIGQRFLLDPRPNKKGNVTAYYIYDAETLKFRGCMQAKLFKVLDSYQDGQGVEKTLQTAQEPPKAFVSAEEVRYEQMSLLDFL